VKSLALLSQDCQLDQGSETYHCSSTPSDT